MSLNFADVANKKMSEIERPELPPVGHYRWKITKLPEITTTADGRWDILNIPVRAVEAVDVEDIGGYKGDVSKIMQSVRFMFDKNDEVEFVKSLNRVKTFFARHVRCCDDNDEIKVALNNSVGQEFMGQLGWKADKNDPEQMFANIVKTAPLD